MRLAATITTQPERVLVRVYPWEGEIHPCAHYREVYRILVFIQREVEDFDYSLSKKILLLDLEIIPFLPAADGITEKISRLAEEAIYLSKYKYKRVSRNHYR